MTRIRIKDLEPIAATKAKTIFGEILHQTSVDRKKFVVNRQGKPVSVIISYNEYCELMERLGEDPGEEIAMKEGLIASPDERKSGSHKIKR